MKKTLIIAKRVFKQIMSDRRYMALSVIAPFLIIYFMKTLFDAFGPGFPSSRYIVPVAGFIVFFLSFVLCAILLVQERNNGTLERMFVSGIKRTQIIGGYTLGYLSLATLQSIITLWEVIFLFQLDYSAEIIISLFIVFWILSIVSVMLGIFVSTFARSEAQVLPFIPLLILPSVFFSGLFVDADKLVNWAYWLGHLLPLYYANQVILELIKPSGALKNELDHLTILTLYGVIMLVLASRTLKEHD